jgi:hypothetical protein
MPPPPKQQCLYGSVLSRRDPVFRKRCRSLGGLDGLWRRVAAVEKAEAEKVQVVKAAEADAEAKYLAGQVTSPSTRLATTPPQPSSHHFPDKTLQPRERFTVLVQGMSFTQCSVILVHRMMLCRPWMRKGFFTGACVGCERREWQGRGRP